MNKEDFVKAMMRHEGFKKAEKRRKLILENKREYMEYTDFSARMKLREKKKKKH